MGMQALSGICFDQEAARKLVTHIQEEMEKIEAEVEPQLPPRRLKKGEEKEYQMPLKPFKKDGSLSVIMAKFLEKHNLTLIGINHIQWEGELLQIYGGRQLPATKPMTLGNQDDIKAFLLESGWSPSLWNYQKDERGKPIRDKKTGEYIKTSPKMQDQGRLCPNLEAMSGELVRPIVRWLSLRNRLAVVSSWLEDKRLALDGRLSAGASGISNTHRFRHTTVVNIPKAEDGVTLGKEMRSLFIARSGYTLVGYDASGLENRMEAHYVFRYPGGPEYAEEILDGDPHTKNAFVFYPRQLSEKGLVFGEVSKETEEFKPFRSKSKNGRYCLSYGGRGPKLASTLGLPVEQGDTLYEAFWNANLPLKMLRDKLTTYWETEGEKRRIKGIDGRYLMTRSKHSLVNTLFQSAGACVMDYSWLFMHEWLGELGVDSEQKPCYTYNGYKVYRVAMMHDEFLLECPPEIAEEVGQMGVKSIEAAGRFLKFNVPLTGSYAIGASWREVH
jgi:hypothetical protein